MSTPPKTIEAYPQLAEAHEAFRGVLANVTPEQLSLPTPSDDWDVRALISHVIWGNRWAEGNVRDGHAEWPDGADAIGDAAPLDVYLASIDAMVAAFADPGAFERTLTMPFGPLPAAMMVEFRMGDLISHAWDLAKATGQDTNLAPALSEHVLAGLRETLATTESRDGQFKDPVPVAADAPAADRLAGYLGKQV